MGSLIDDAVAAYVSESEKERARLEQLESECAQDKADAVARANDTLDRILGRHDGLVPVKCLLSRVELMMAKGDSMVDDGPIDGVVVYKIGDDKVYENQSGTDQHELPARYIAVCFGRRAAEDRIRAVAATSHYPVRGYMTLCEPIQGLGELGEFLCSPSAPDARVARWRLRRGN